MSFYHAAPLYRSWGGAQRPAQSLAEPRFRDEIAALIAARPQSALAVGLARSYGDSGLNSAGGLIGMAGVDRLISFDPAARILRAEAGLSLHALLKLVTPHNLFTTTSPGTAFVTLGGAIANDVHGKNHHTAGTFGCGVRRIGLRRSTGETLDLAPGDALFAATIGGLGLTGLIEWVELDLAAIPGPAIENEDIAFNSLGEFFALCGECADYEHTVAWIDASNGERGIFSRGNWTAAPAPSAKKRALNAPIEPPLSPLNALTLRAFNEFFFQVKKGGAGRKRILPYSSALHPLDGIHNWNRLYGRKGFWQYQSVVPMRDGEAVTRAMLQAVSRSGAGSFLAVLKTFGEKPSPGMMSFPMPGVTLAIDMPHRGGATLALLVRLDDIVKEAGGRLYPAKDGRIPNAMMRAGYPRLDEFLSFVDPGFSSDFYRRALSP